MTLYQHWTAGKMLTMKQGEGTVPSVLTDPYFAPPFTPPPPQHPTTLAHLHTHKHGLWQQRKSFVRADLDPAPPSPCFEGRNNIYSHPVHSHSSCFTSRYGLPMHNCRPCPSPVAAILGEERDIRGKIRKK